MIPALDLPTSCRDERAMFLKPGFFATSAHYCLSLLCAGLLLRTSFADDKDNTKQPAQANTIENGNVVIGPDYQTDPDLTDKGNPKGKSFTFTMALADSKIFRGDDSTLTKRQTTRKERKIFVYVPAAYKDGTKAPMLVTLDGPSNLDLVSNALDNLTISDDPVRKLPAFVVISVENGGGDGKGSERGLEYDTMSDRFAQFIHDECFRRLTRKSKAYPNAAFLGGGVSWVAVPAGRLPLPWGGFVPTCFAD